MNPKVLVGKPVIKGTRIAVEFIVLSASGQQGHHAAQPLMFASNLVLALTGGGELTICLFADGTTDGGWRRRPLYGARLGGGWWAPLSARAIELSCQVMAASGASNANEEGIKYGDFAEFMFPGDGR